MERRYEILQYFGFGRSVRTKHDEFLTLERCANAFFVHFFSLSCCCGNIASVLVNMQLDYSTLINTAVWLVFGIGEENLGEPNDVLSVMDTTSSYSYSCAISLNIEFYL